MVKDRYYFVLNIMSIFGGGSDKNKVYLRRRSIRLNGWALGLSVLITMSFGVYFVVNRYSG